MAIGAGTEMMIVMVESATAKRGQFLELLEGAGARGHVSTSDRVTVIGYRGGEG